MNADNGINVNSPISTANGSLDLDGDADNGVDGNDRINLAADLTSGTTLVLDATTGGIFLQSNGTWTAGGTVTINNNVDGAFDLTIEAGNSNINIVGSFGSATELLDVVLNGGNLFGDVNAQSLEISGLSAVLTGTVNGQGGQPAAVAVTLSGIVAPGPYTMNGFPIGGQIGGTTEIEFIAATLSSTVEDTQILQTLLGTTAPSHYSLPSIQSQTPQDALVRDVILEPLEPDIFSRTFALINLSDDLRVVLMINANILDYLWAFTIFDGAPSVLLLCSFNNTKNEK